MSGTASHSSARATGTPAGAVGLPYTRVDAWERVTGRALFGADVSLPGMLHGKVLRSPHPHAAVRAVDASAARRHPGVRAVVTHLDLPREEAGGESFAGELQVDAGDLRRLALAHEKALFDGHAIAAVAATTARAAEEAVDLIRVEYEELPPVEDALRAMEPGSPVIHPHLRTSSLSGTGEGPTNVASVVEHGWGDVEEGFRRADAVVERSYRTQMVHQGYLEPQACLARWEPDGSLTVWTSTQGTFNSQRMLATLLQMPLHHINVVPAEVGGGFGGKIYVILEPLAALLSRESGRPVRMVMDRSEVFRATGPGSPQDGAVRVGATRDGRIVAASARLVLDAGAFPGAPVAGAASVAFGPYRMESFRLEAYDVVTNKPRVQAYRAPGGTPAAFAVESTMDELAERLEMDPLQFRKVNAVKEGDPAASGRPYPRIGLHQVLERVESSDHWNAPLPGPGHGRGLALGYWPGATLTSTCVVTLNVDGTVEVTSGQVDLTGTRTTMAQMAAEELEIPVERVRARTGDTASTPYTDLSAGSRTTYTQSQAVAGACREVIELLRALAADQLHMSPEDLEYRCGTFRAHGSPERRLEWGELASLSRTRGGGPVQGHGYSGRLRGAPAFAAHVADVEVDPETGGARVRRYTCFQDVGRAINPVQVEGQVQGGAAQGIGWALSEEYDYKEGRLRNPNLLDYRCLTSADLPPVEVELVEVPAQDGPYGARGVGEVPIVPPGAALASAIYRAAGARVRELPMTPQRVRGALPLNSSPAAVSPHARGRGGQLPYRRPGR